MHSGGMRTSRLWTISHSIPCIWGGSVQPLLDADPTEADAPFRMQTPWRQTPLAM